jgi:hypothetical protein
MQVGFLHRSKDDRAAYYCVFVSLDVGTVSRCNRHLPWPLDRGGREAMRLNAAIVRAKVEAEEHAGYPMKREFARTSTAAQSAVTISLSVALPLHGPRNTNWHAISCSLPTP